MERNTYFKEEVVKAKFNFSALKRILKYAVPYKWTFLILLVFSFIAVGLSLMPPILISYFVDNLADNENLNLFIVLVAVFFSLAVMEAMFNFFVQRMTSKNGHTIIKQVRLDIFEKLQRLPFDYFDSRPTGKIVVRVTSYIDDLANFFANTLLNFVLSILRVLIVLIFMLFISPILTLIVLATIIPLGTTIFLLRKVVAGKWRQQRANDSSRAAFIHESIMGVNIIKAFNREPKNSEIYMEVHSWCQNNWADIVKVNEFFTPSVNLIWNLGFFGISFVAFASIISGNMTVGTTIAFLTYLGMFTAPITSLSMVFQQMAMVSSNLERIFETMDTDEQIVEKPNAITKHNCNGLVEYKNVTFAYEQDINVLENFNLTVKSGERISLVGPTGAGKTTIVNLLTRFYDRQQGEILIDGIDITDYTLDSLRSIVGVMMQDSFIFKQTILENIRYGKPSATDEECVTAAKKIFADEFIMRMPNGYNTMLSERGEGLSSGEKQLLSFARIALKNPKILILDEATSSIDSKMEERIQDALEIMLEGKTSFVIAHRLSTIKNSDRILYISDKGIQEEGCHAELMRKKGLYYKLVKNQS